MEEQKIERERIQQQFSSMMQNLSSNVNTIHNIKSMDEAKEMEEKINQQQYKRMLF